jgi:hypothetical protein
LGKALTEGNTVVPSSLPNFQRRFVWDEKDVGRLLQDVDAIAFPVNSKSRTTAHFTGAVVFAPSEGGGRSIIDGQQRLTVLMLTLLAAGKLLGDKSLIDDATTSSPTPRFLIEPDIKDQRQALAVRNDLLDAGHNHIASFPGVESPWKGGRYWKAYKQAEKHLEGLSTNLRRRKFIQAFREQLWVARIQVKDELLGASVFSSLNDTGQVLEPADLVRVFIQQCFPATSKGVKEADEFFKKDWSMFESRFSSSDGNSATDRKISDFFYHYASARINQNVTRMSLLADLTSHWKTELKGRPSKILDELEEWRVPYQIVAGQVALPRSAAPGGPIDYLEALRRLQNNPNANVYWTYAIQLTHAVGTGKSGVSKKKAADCLRILESFTIRKAIADSQLAGIRLLLLPLFNGRGSNNKGAVRADAEKLRDSLRALSDDLRGPTNEELEAALEDLTNGFYRLKAFRFVLMVRERHQRVKNRSSTKRADSTEKTDAGVASFEELGSLTLDHIYPQKPSGDWELKPAGKLERESFARIKHSAGNLVLLEEPLNKARDSASWQSLVNEYELSSVRDTAKISEAVENARTGHPLWSLEDMKARAREISDWMITDAEGWQQPW